jgi:hypothetical protein
MLHVRHSVWTSAFGILIELRSLLAPHNCDHLRHTVVYIDVQKETIMKTKH